MNLNAKSSGNYLLYTKLDQTPYGAYLIEEKGETYPVEDFMDYVGFEYNTHQRAEEKLRRKIDDKQYDKIKTWNNNKIILHLAEMNANEYSRLENDLRYWKSNKQIPSNSPELKNQIAFLEGIKIKFINWFNANEIDIPIFDFRLKQNPKRKMIWYLSEEKLNSFLRDCIGKEYIADTEDLDQYIANFISKDQNDFVKAEPIKIVWLTTITDLVYLINQLCDELGLIDKKNKWALTAQIFISKELGELNSTDLSIVKSNMLRTKVKRPIVDKIISKLSNKP